MANYRYYDEEEHPQKGIYAEIFEEEYKNLISKPKYHTLYKEVDVETLLRVFIIVILPRIGERSLKGH
jgi:type III restriction enzyme